MSCSAIQKPVRRYRAAGEPGELVLGGVPGADIFLEYLDDPAATGRALVRRTDGTWFLTGDMVTRADDGALRFVGRRDDVIKVSGENVSLTEVEATLALGQHPPAVSDLAAWSERNLAAAARPRETGT